MKRVNYLWMIVMSVSIFVTSCSSEDLKVPLQDREGAVFLEGGEYVEATTEFSEDELKEKLCSGNWNTNRMPYIYDTYNCQQTYYEPDALVGAPYPVWQFKSDGTYIDYSCAYPEYAPNGKFIIKGNHLYFTEERSFSGTEPTTIVYTVVGISSKYIILDRDYEDGICNIPKSFMKFDKDVANVRYMWTIYNN